MLASFSRLRGSPSPTLAIIQISREGRDFLEESDDFIKWRNGIHRSRSFLRTGIPYSVIRVTVSFFVPFFPSFLFPSFERTTGVLARLCRPLSRNRLYARISFYCNACSTSFFASREPINSTQYFASPSFGIFFFFRTWHFWRKLINLILSHSISWFRFVK